MHLLCGPFIPSRGQMLRPYRCQHMNAKAPTHYLNTCSSPCRIRPNIEQEVARDAAIIRAVAYAMVARGDLNIPHLRAVRAY